VEHQTSGSTRVWSVAEEVVSVENSSDANAYVGLIDDVRVHNRAISDAEAAQLAATTPA